MHSSRIQCHSTMSGVNYYLNSYLTKYLAQTVQLIFLNFGKFPPQICEYIPPYSRNFRVILNEYGTDLPSLSLTVDCRSSLFLFLLQKDTYVCCTEWNPGVHRTSWSRGVDGDVNTRLSCLAWLPRQSVAVGRPYHVWHGIGANVDAFSPTAIKLKKTKAVQNLVMDL